MGYMTSYSLEWSGDQPAVKQCEHCGGSGKITVEDAVQEYVDTALAVYGGTETLASVLDESCKWYEHEEEMKAVSREFPEVLFTLRGEGEESGDIWVKYFKNGKMQESKAQISLAPFDPKQLK